MKPIGPFRYLSRWNRRAVVLVVVLLLCAWLGFFVMGMFPLHYLNFSLYQGLLAMACGFVLFLVWLTILISPGIPRQERPLRETAWRLTAAGGCLLLEIILAVAGGGPRRLGTRIGGMLGVGLKPIRDLQRSPAVIALAQGRESARLPKDQWPDSIVGTGSGPFEWKEPRDILVLPSPAESPSLRMYYGRGSADVFVQNREPDEARNVGDCVVEQWADDIWLCRNIGD